MLTKDELTKKYSEEETQIILDRLEGLENEFSNHVELLFYAKEIANIVISLKLDYQSVCAALIFPFAKNNLLSTDTELEDKELKTLVSMLLKCEQLSKSYSDADGLKEMLLAITKDIRVIIIKSAEVLVFARKNVKNTQNNEAIYIFKTIDDIFAPISARLGLSEIKSELQDLSFEFHEPEMYEWLKNEVQNETRASEQMINSVVQKLKTLLSNSQIQCTCYGRVKHLSSIFNKLRNKNCSLKNIYDISAVRILVNTVSECYMALGIVHANFVPVDGRFKDYIAHPKPNGYKSIHTTVYFEDEFFEVQIRTYDMHDFAEYGVAAHFLYKEHKKSLADVDNKLLWIRRMLENKEAVSSEKLLEELKTDVYLGEIFVQTPKGKVVKLVENATPVDFAYSIHSEIGNSCVGARVNGAMVPLLSSLSNGDVVEILTSNSSKGPSRDWVKKVKMQSTKDKINYFFKKQMKEENIKLGKSMIEQYAKANDVILSSIMKDEWINPILKKSAFVSLDELYAAVGYGSISAEKVVGRLLSQKQAEERKNKVVLSAANRSAVKFDDNSAVLGTEGMLTKYCKCCNPIPGDDIVGYVSRGRGIIIHKKSCENVKKLPESRFIKVEWNTKNGNNTTFISYIDLIAKNTNNVYLEITNALSELSVKVASLNTSENKFGELLLRVGVYVKDKTALLQVRNKLGSLSCVFEVK